MVALTEGNSPYTLSKLGESKLTSELTDSNEKTYTSGCLLAGSDWTWPGLG